MKTKTVSLKDDLPQPLQDESMENHKSKWSPRVAGVWTWMTCPKVAKASMWMTYPRRATAQMRSTKKTEALLSH